MAGASGAYAEAGLAARSPMSPAMDTNELQQRIDSFPRWHYGFEFDGGAKTPVADAAELNRHRAAPPLLLRRAREDLRRLAAG